MESTPESTTAKAKKKRITMSKKNVFDIKKIKFD